eukprot:c19497_g1_i2.p1 GENE.c19497_g1_i2~~c19497_g1_i2.p1  ORF type:complete len:697 (-),score=162.51 c19497_g1_i2:735-2780(-)
MAHSNISLTLEGMLPEIQDLTKRGLITEAEAKSIIKSRTQHEHLLQGRMTTRDDFMRAINFELTFQSLKAKRRVRFNIKKRSRGDFAGETRIHTLFQRALRRFRSDQRLWLQYIDFCIQCKSNRVLTKLFSRALSLFPKNEGLWVLAASHEFENNLNSTAARVILQRALRVNPKSARIWQEYLRFECLFVLKLRERQSILLGENDKSTPEAAVETAVVTVAAKEDESAKSDEGSEASNPEEPDLALGDDDDVELDLNEPCSQQPQETLPPPAPQVTTDIFEGSVARVALNHALQAIPGDPNFALSLIRILHSTGLAALALEFAKHASTLFPNNTDCWQARAELEIGDDPVKRLEMSWEVMHSSKSPETVEYFVREAHAALYGSGSRVSPAEFDSIRERLTGAIPHLNGLTAADATPLAIYLWIDHLHQNLPIVAPSTPSKRVTRRSGPVLPDSSPGVAAPSLSALTASQAALAVFPKSLPLLLQHLSLVVASQLPRVLWEDIQPTLVQTGKVLRSHPDEEGAQDLWSSLELLCFAHAPTLGDTETVLFGGALSAATYHHAPTAVLVAYLKFVYRSEGLEAVRHAYSKCLVGGVPPSVLLWCLEVELNHPNAPRDQKQQNPIRALFTKATQLYGATVWQVWLEWARYELSCNDVQQAGAIHWRALRTLTNPAPFVHAYNALK